MRHHQLSPPVFEALASTGEDVSAVEALLDVECSRRLLMLRTILDACASTPMVGEAWELLERAEGLDPKDERRLQYVRWSLDRIEDAVGGEDIDELERLVEVQERFAERVNAFANEVRTLLKSKSTTTSKSRWVAR